MQVSVETLKGLERKLTVLVPSKTVEEKVGERLRELTRTVRMDGFRPGMVPLNVVTKRYETSVRYEVAQNLVQTTLTEALEQHDLSPAARPTVDALEVIKGEDFKYSALFEVMPVFEIFELNKTPVDLIRSEVKDQDINAMLEKLREQHGDWHEVSHAAQTGNKVHIDFEGFIEGRAFEGGSAKDQDLILGSGSMIPGFEAGIIGKKAGEDFDIQVQFPKDYGHPELADKEATFKITLRKVMESKLPELDDAFAERFHIKSGGIEALRQDIKENMGRELEKRVSILNREKLYDKLLELNQFDLPSSLIDVEIEHLKHEAYHRIFGHEHRDNEKIPDFPRKLFEDQAKRRVHLGLLFSEYVKKHGIVADNERVNLIIDKFAQAYESPDEMRALYRNNKERRAEIEAFVMEEMVAEKIALDATTKYIDKDYDAVMNAQQGTENKGE